MPGSRATTTSTTSTTGHVAGVPSDDAPTTTDAELAGRLRVAVVRLNRKLRQQSLGGLSPSQSSALGSINRLGNPTLGELAEAEQVQPPTMTRVVSALEGAGLIVRESTAPDRRVVRVRLTDEGARTIERIRTLKDAFLSRRLAELGPAEKALAEPLAALLEHLVEDQ